MSAAAQPLTDKREQIYQALSVPKDESPNRHWLAKILASWLNGQSVLPDYLGLEPVQFAYMLNTFFPGTEIAPQAPSHMQLDFSRMLEKEDLVKLLVYFGRKQDQETGLMINLIVSACLGNDHLWQDLGLWQRTELTALLNYNFPELALRNDKDMKWKKFLYKQLCEAEGLYLCRAPSCEVCNDYSDCFGPEE